MTKKAQRNQSKESIQWRELEQLLINWGKKISSGKYLISNTRVNLYWLKTKISKIKQYTIKRNQS